MKGLRKVLGFVGKGLDALFTKTLVLFFLAWHAAVALFFFFLDVFTGALKYSLISEEPELYLLLEDKDL